MTANRHHDLLQDGPAALMSRAIVRLCFVAALLIVLALAGCGAAVPSSGQHPVPATSSTSPA